MFSLCFLVVANIQDAKTIGRLFSEDQNLWDPGCWSKTCRWHTGVESSELQIALT